MLRQQGGGGKAADRARRSSGLGVWNEVLRCPLPPDATMVCYVDDTLVLVGGRGWHETLRIDEVATAYAIRAVRGLGLRISLAK